MEVSPRVCELADTLLEMCRGSPIDLKTAFPDADDLLKLPGATEYCTDKLKGFVIPSEQISKEFEANAKELHIKMSTKEDLERINSKPVDASPPVIGAQYGGNCIWFEPAEFFTTYSRMWLYFRHSEYAMAKYGHPGIEIREPEEYKIDNYETFKRLATIFCDFDKPEHFGKTMKFVIIHKNSARGLVIQRDWQSENKFVRFPCIYDLPTQATIISESYTAPPGVGFCRGDHQFSYLMAVDPSMIEPKEDEPSEVEPEDHGF